LYCASTLREITGRLTIAASDLEALETAQVREYIFQRLQALESEARATRQPIPCEELMELCIAPGDLLYVQGRRYYDLGKWDSWDELDDDEAELDETFWQDIAMLASKQRVHPANGQRASDECPLCSTLVHSSLASARIEHWQFEHPGQDLTFNQASWVLDQISTPGQITGKKQCCETYPPAYRAPHERGCP
jgi:hypothetical protein